VTLGGMRALDRPRSGLARAGIAGLAVIALGCATSDPTPTQPPPEPVHWQLDSLAEVGGHAVTVLGDPIPIESPFGPALEFDGVDDALFLDVNPLEGATEFTVEVMFRPDSGGGAEQRFLHFQEDGSKDRTLFETRLPRPGVWFLDTYIKSDGEGYTLFARDHRHGLDRWYHAALVVRRTRDGAEMRHYVDSVVEMRRPIDLLPPAAGRVSIGVRINRVDWFRGAVSYVRITQAALELAQFQSFPSDRQ
jgi:hypothetical protein